jgi:hypothetical protein
MEGIGKIEDTLLLNSKRDPIISFESFQELSRGDHGGHDHGGKKCSGHGGGQGDHKERLLGNDGGHSHGGK